MNLKEQSYVCMLAQTGSITAAAKMLSISQPALTLYIQNLERNLGVKLFDRVGKRFVLTYPGQLYVDTARQMLALKENFDGKLSSIFADFSGRIRLGIQETRSSYLFPRILERFQVMHPNIEIQLQERRNNELVRLLHSNEIDLALCNRPLKTADMDRIQIYDDSMKLMVPRGTAIRTQEPRTAGGLPWVELQQLQDWRFVLSPVGYSSRERAEEIMRDQEFKPARLLSVQKTSTHIALVSRGLAVGFIQPGYLAENGQEHMVDLYDVTEDKGHSQFDAIFLKGRQLPAYANTIIDLAREIMNGGQQA